MILKRFAKHASQILIVLVFIELLLRLLQILAPADNVNTRGMTLLSFFGKAGRTSYSAGMISSPEFVSAIVKTLGHAFIASIIAVVSGLMIGFGAGYSRVLRFVVSPIVDFFRSIPVTLMSVVVVAAFSRNSDVVVVALCAIPCAATMAFMIFKGISTMEKDEHRARVFALNYEIKSKIKMFLVYHIPLLSPDIAAGIKLVFSYAIVLSCVLEMLGMGISASAGRRIGEILDNSGGDIGGTPLLLILTLGIMAYLANRLLDRLEAEFANHKY